MVQPGAWCYAVIGTWPETPWIVIHAENTRISDDMLSDSANNFSFTSLATKVENREKYI